MGAILCVQEDVPPVEEMTTIEESTEPASEPECSDNGHNEMSTNEVSAVGR